MTPIDNRALIAIFAGGFIGAIARAWLVELLPHEVDQWPWPTFAANVLGAAAVGYFATRLQERLPLSAYRHPFLATGLCGAVTTFSLMQLELVRMLEHGHVLLALAYSTTSVLAGFLAVTVATKLVRRASIAG